MKWNQPGERGKIGDHGQDGRQGEQGEQGPVGPPGDSEAVREVDRQVREALALALDEKQRERDKIVDRQLNRVDRRLLIVYTLVTLGLLGAYALDERQDRRDAREDREFRRSIATVCEVTNEGNEKVNVLLSNLAKNAQTNRARTEVERAQIAETYRGLMLPVVACPPAA